mmetsp:Transcript_51026/g.119354  ORF Transcript_51026/g.119354 Transcript_51026/m.119354 type:complete len:80 (-) Transcript_51026:101-340(-)
MGGARVEAGDAGESKISVMLAEWDKTSLCKLRVECWLDNLRADWCLLSFCPPPFLPLEDAVLLLVNFFGANNPEVIVVL